VAVRHASCVLSGNWPVSSPHQPEVATSAVGLESTRRKNLKRGLITGRSQPAAARQLIGVVSGFMWRVRRLPGRASRFQGPVRGFAEAACSQNREVKRVRMRVRCKLIDVGRLQKGVNPFREGVGTLRKAVDALRDADGAVRSATAGFRNAIAGSGYGDKPFSGREPGLRRADGRLCRAFGASGSAARPLAHEVRGVTSRASSPCV